MKIFDIKDVFSWSNAEEAKQYIGKECYFADSIFTLQDNINNNKVYILEKVANNDKTDVTSLFIFFGPVSEFRWGLCLPADKVKEIEEEKKYRPFKNVDEFTHILGVSIGEVVIFRSKEKTQQKGEIHTILVGYLKTENGDDGIIFGGSNGSWSLQDIFENLEWKSKRDGEWQPFGVLDES